MAVSFIGRGFKLGVLGENHWSATSQTTWSHIVVSSTPCHEWDSIQQP
jgi:hypothetical protein